MFTARRRTRQRLYLHVGLPKSGTSYLQALLAENRPALRGAGYVYPFVRREGMFHAAVELTSQHDLWGLSPALVDGTWDRLLGRVRETGDVGVVSHEILAGAAGAPLSRVARDTADLDLHVVVTARDLARQVPAHWQEQVKNGATWSFAEFEQRLFGPEESSDRELGFWRSQHLVEVLERWSSVVPPENVHVVPVPRRGTDPGELWRRFAEAIELDPAVLDAAALEKGAAQAGNDSLAAARIRLLRMVLAALDGRVQQPAYAHVVKRWFAQQRLARMPGRRAVVPPPLHHRLVEVAGTWPTEIRRRGYRVHGHLEDLLPAAGGPPADGPHPDDVTAEELLEGVPELLASALEEIARLRFPGGGPPGSSLGA